MEGKEYAGFWSRALAIFIDNAAWLIVVATILGWLPVNPDDVSDLAAGIALIVVVSLWFNYFAFCEWRWGHTVGKSAAGIEVRSLDGAERLSYGQASLRNLLRLVDFWLIGELMIVSSERKQRLGDRAAKTVVVRRKLKLTRAANAESAPAAQPISGGADPVVPAAPPPPPPAAKVKRAEPTLPKVTWSFSDSIWWLIGGLLIVVIVPPLLVLPFDSKLATDPNNASDAAILATQALFDGFLIAIAVAVASGWKFNLRTAFGRLGLRGFQPSAFGWMFAVLGIYYVGAIAFSALIIKPEQEDIGKELGVCNPGIGIAVFAVLSIVVLAPFAEEIFFRGFFFAGLRQRWSLWPSALLSGAIFGLVHAPTGPTAAIPLAGLGVGLAWLYNKTGSIYPSMLAHLLNNAIAISVVIGQC
jgi:membrane protease YdiL (CAAX protease family)